MVNLHELRRGNRELARMTRTEADYHLSPGNIFRPCSRTIARFEEKMLEGALPGSIWARRVAENSMGWGIVHKLDYLRACVGKEEFTLASLAVARNAGRQLEEAGPEEPLEGKKPNQWASELASLSQKILLGLADLAENCVLRLSSG